MWHIRVLFGFKKLAKRCDYVEIWLTLFSFVKIKKAAQVAVNNPNTRLFRMFLNPWLSLDFVFLLSERFEVTKILQYNQPKKVGHHLEESFLDGPYCHPDRCFMCLNKSVKIAKRFIQKNLPDLLKQVVLNYLIIA